MRKMMFIAAIALAATQFVAAADQQLERRGERERVPSAWAKRVTLTSAEMNQAVAAAAVAEVTGKRPIVLLETNYYTFLPGERLQLRMTLHPNGFTAPASMYLYRENRVTGERRYYSTVRGGLQHVGMHADLFGTTAAPVAVTVPQLNDFVLFGSAGDTSPISWSVNGALGAGIEVAPNDHGLHQWVLELRDAAGRRVISRSNAMFSHIRETVTVSGTITASTTWTADRRYVLNDFVGVAAPAVLTIEPGTVIYGGGARASLFIQRGARIMADGTLRRPIIFTSAQKTGERSQRDWGGLVLLGRAPINEPGGQAFLEGLPSTPAYAFGGTDPEDNSGVVRFVRLEFGGYEIEANQEINGITLGGVGRGTTLEYIQVLHNKDDAFEFFGGTVNARYLLAVAAADDIIDYDLGYQGNIQFVVSIKRPENDENDGNVLIEGDGHPQNFNLTPRTSPRVYNITGIGTERTDVGAYGNVIRRGAAGRVHNMIIMSSRRAPLTIRDDATFNQAGLGDLVVDNSILFGDFSDGAFASSSDRPAQTRNFLFEQMKHNRNVDPMLAYGAVARYKTLMPDVMPLPGSPALDLEFVQQPPDDGFFEPVDFIGAVGPGNNWVLSGWATFSDN